MTKNVPCRKRRFNNELDAKLALASTQRAKASKRDEKRIYRCPTCKGWHLTSMGTEG